MDIRIERPNDRIAIASVQRGAFGDQGVVVAALVETLRHRTDPATFVSLVADEAGSVVGHVLFSPSYLDAPARLVDVAVLSPVGVLPAYQRQSIGTALITQGLDMLDQRGVPLVFLEGDPRYYARFGFEPAGPLGFRRPSLRIPETAFQVKRLAAFESAMSGTLVYTSAFWDLDVVGLRAPEA